MDDISTTNITPESTQAEASQPKTSEQSAAPEQVHPPASVKKKFKYKADGAEIEEELDDSEITNRLSLAKAAQKRMQEASTTKKQVESFVKALKEDPMSVLSDPKIMGNEKFQEIAEAFLAKRLQEQLLTPEERAQAEKDERLSKYEKAEKERAAAAEKAQAEQLEAKYRDQYEKTIISALEASTLPKTPFTVKRMAELMQKNIQHGLDLEPNQLAQMVKEDYQAELRGVIGSAGPEQLLAMFGEDIANKIRKHDLSRLQVKNPQPKQIDAQKPAVESGRKMTPREYNEYLKAKFVK